MTYLPLNTILAELDAQQRRELMSAAEGIDEKHLKKKTEAKRRLAAEARFFIERSWEALAPELDQFSLVTASGKSEAELREYLRGLYDRQPGFAWGWTRARMNDYLLQTLDEVVPTLLKLHAERSAEYVQALRRVDHYWFRLSPIQHLKAGYHTALCVACKWYGSAYELRRNSSEPHPVPDFNKQLRLFASFSMTMLARTDGYLWDSAGAEPMDAIFEDGVLMPVEREMEILQMECAPDFGARLGCPALRARRAEGEPALTGIVDWVEREFERWLT